MWNLLESELKHAGLTMSQVTESGVLPGILKQSGFQVLDDMYAAIGYGGYTAIKAVNRIRSEITGGFYCGLRCFWPV